MVLKSKSKTTNDKKSTLYPLIVPKIQTLINPLIKIIFFKYFLGSGYYKNHACWIAKEVGILFLPLVEFAYNNSYHRTIGMAPYEVLYGRKCRFPIHWDIVGERKMLGPKIVQQTSNIVAKICESMTTAQSRQKNYADSCRKNLDFNIRDMVFLKVAPMKGVMRVGKKGKLSPRYIRPFEIVESVGTMSYRLAQPPALAGVPKVFHVPRFFTCAEL